MLYPTLVFGAVLFLYLASIVTDVDTVNPSQVIRDAKERKQVDAEDKRQIKQAKAKARQDRHIKKGKFGKKESNVRKIMNEMFPGAEFKSCLPRWLRNPKTKRLLQLDCYSERLQIAVELDGPFHHVFMEHYHKTLERFRDLQFRDRLKERLCLEHGVKLIRVPDSVPDLEIAGYVRNRL